MDRVAQPDYETKHTSRFGITSSEERIKVGERHCDCDQRHWQDRLEFTNCPKPIYWLHPHPFRNKIVAEYGMIDCMKIDREKVST